MQLNFSDIYTQYYQRSFLFVKSYVRDAMAAEDIVSETMVSLWKTLCREEVLHPQALLLSMLKNASLNYLKHQDVRQEAFENIASQMMNDLAYRINTLEACNPEEIYSTEITGIVEKTLATLPPQTRRVFEMRRYDAMPVKEVADALAMNPKTIEYHLTKAAKALRAALVDYLPLIFFLFLS
jgi:RNA polymerase sigma-70 factor (ECF subfamily)